LINKDPSEKILGFAKHTLKSEFSLPKSLNIEKKISPDGSTNYSSRILIEDRDFLVEINEGPDGSGLSQGISTGFNNQESSTLEAVIIKFNEYYKMPNVPQSSWKVGSVKTKAGKEGFTYEVISENKDGSIDTRSAYALPYDKSQNYTYILTACSIKKNSALFKGKTCLIED
jgi:hypothetical protein